MTAYLALDLGASSARVSYGVVTPSGIELVEVARFHNHPVTRDGVLYWDGTELRRQSLDGIASALAQLKERDIRAVSVGMRRLRVCGSLGSAQKDVDEQYGHHGDSDPHSLLPSSDEGFLCRPDHLPCVHTGVHAGVDRVCEALSCGLGDCIGHTAEPRVDCCVISGA